MLLLTPMLAPVLTPMLTPVLTSVLTQPWVLQVFCFIMKEKGTSWAYATPGFGASLSAGNLRQLRHLTGTPFACIQASPTTLRL